MFSNIRQCCQVTRDLSKVTKIYVWMIQRLKNEVFGHFSEFGFLDRLDIAYCDCAKCFPTFACGNRSWRITQNYQKCIFEWSKELKKWVLTVCGSLVCWVNLIMQIDCLLQGGQRPFNEILSIESRKSSLSLWDCFCNAAVGGVAAGYGGKFLEMASLW